jgi:hypothetical protein
MNKGQRLKIESGLLGPGSIPPRATKKYQNHLRVVFSFGLSERLRDSGFLTLVAYTS